MKRYLGCLLFSSLVLFLVPVYAQKPGEVYFGMYTYELNGESQSYGIIFDECTNNEVAARFLWPEFHNTVTQGRCKKKKGGYYGREAEVVQGFEYSLKTDIDYSFRMVGKDSIVGKAYFGKGGELLGNFYLKNIKNDSSFYKREMRKAQEKFGKVILTKKELSERDMVLQKCIDFEKNYEFNAMKMKGEGKVKGMKMEILSYFQNEPYRSYYEMNIFGNKIITGLNENYEWDYSGITDQVTVRELGEEEKKGSSDFFGTSKSVEDQNLISVTYAYLNGEKTYRLKFQDGDTISCKYLDIENFLLLRSESSFKAMIFDNYQLKKDSFYIPHLIAVLSKEEQVQMDMEEMEVFDSLPDSLFNIPEGYEHKKVEKRKSSNDYNTEGNKRFEEGNYEQAIELYSKAINLNPYDKVYFNNRGKAKMELGRYYEAIADFQKSNKIIPNLDAYADLGMAKLKLGDFKSAINEYKKALELDSLNPIIISNLGYIYFLSGKYDSAIESFEPLIDLDTTLPSLGYLGVSYAELGRYQEAIDVYRRVIKVDEENAELYNYLGVSYFGIENYDSAVACFKKAIDLVDTSVQFRENYARALYELKNYEEAKEQFHDLVKGNKENHAYINFEAMCNYHIGNKKKALSLLDKAIELYDKDATYFDNRAYIKQDMMDYKGAIDDFSSSITLYPDDAEVYYQRGVTNMYIHNKLSSCKDLKKAKDMGHEEAGETFDKQCK